MKYKKINDYFLPGIFFLQPQKTDSTLKQLLQSNITQQEGKNLKRNFLESW